MNVSVREENERRGIIADIKTQITENLLFRNKPLPDVKTARNRTQLTVRHYSVESRNVAGQEWLYISQSEAALTRDRPIRAQGLLRWRKSTASQKLHPSNIHLKGF